MRTSGWRPTAGTTVYVWVRTVSLPATSVAVTVTDFAPSVDVLMGEPLATVPTQDEIPDPPDSSAQEKAALTTELRATRALAAGVVSVTVGSVTSTTVYEWVTTVSLPATS